MTNRRRSLTNQWINFLAARINAGEDVDAALADYGLMYVKTEAQIAMTHKQDCPAHPEHRDTVEGYGCICKPTAAEWIRKQDCDHMPSKAGFYWVMVASDYPEPTYKTVMRVDPEIKSASCVSGGNDEWETVYAYWSTPIETPEDLPEWEQ